MEVEYRLEEKDLVALAKCRMESSPKYVRSYRLQRWGLLAFFGSFAVVAAFILHKPSMALYTGALALFIFGLYPFYYRWLIGQTLRRIVGARLNPTIFGVRTLRLRSDGMEQALAGKVSATPWSAIGPVMVTSHHAFIAIDGVFGQVIPRERVGEQRFLDFVKALRAGEF
jgi:hypothetical protein